MQGLALKIRTALVTSWTLKVAQTLQIIRVCNRLSNQWWVVALWLATGSANTYELCMWFQALQNKQWWAFTIRTDWMTMDFANCDGLWEKASHLTCASLKRTCVLMYWPVGSPSLPFQVQLQVLCPFTYCCWGAGRVLSGVYNRGVRQEDIWGCVTTPKTLRSWTVHVVK